MRCKKIRFQQSLVSAAMWSPPMQCTQSCANLPSCSIKLSTFPPIASTTEGTFFTTPPDVCFPSSTSAVPRASAAAIVRSFHSCSVPLICTTSGKRWRSGSASCVGERCLHSQPVYICIKSHQPYFDPDVRNAKYAGVTGDGA